MGRKYIDSPCIKRLIAKGRIPMLFIGSGISRRYLKNYPSWEELLYYVANEIGVSKGQFLAMKQEITSKLPKENKGKVFAELASWLTKTFREKILSGTIFLEDFFTSDEINKIEKHNISFSKMLISKKMSQYELTNRSGYLSELRELKKLQGNIGAVVTTNYDKFLEKEVFNNFDVFVEQSQYYMTECMGIGEVYKIHGSVDSPNSLVFTTEDYSEFENNLKVIAAKLLNLALEYPIIFIGYSLEDENVLKIFETLIESLNEEQLLTLSENLIYVEWEPHEELLKESKKSVNRLGKSLEMTCISTDNYFVLYKHLMKFVPAEKPERVRKYKKMIQKIILNNNSGKATIVTNDDLDKLNSEGKLVIAFGKHDQFARMGIIGIKVEDIITWVLEQKKDIGEDYANDIFEYFYMTSRVQSNHYVPMFYLCKFTDKYNNTEKLKNMESNLVSWVDKIINDKNLKIYKDIKEAHDDSGIQSISYYLKCIVKTYSQGKIDYLECLDILNKLNEKQSLLKNTDFRKAVTYLDLKK